MSSERLKKNAEMIVLGIKIANILTIISVVLQSITLLWLTIMPNKLIHFFEKVRIYEFYVTDIDNTELSFFELSSGIAAFLFLFVILSKAKELFEGLAKGDGVLSFSEILKKLSLYFLAESVFVPVMRIISFSVFIKNMPSTAAFDISSFVIALALWFLSKAMDTESVEK